MLRRRYKHGLFPFPGVGSRFHFHRPQHYLFGGKAISMTIDVPNTAVIQRRKSQVSSVNVVAFTNRSQGVFHELRQQQPTALL